MYIDSIYLLCEQNKNKRKKQEEANEEKEEEMLYTQYLHAHLLVLRLNGERSVEKRRGKALEQNVRRKSRKPKKPNSVSSILQEAPAILAYLLLLD